MACDKSYRNSEMISYNNALEIIQQFSLTTQTKIIPIENTLNAIAAEDVTSKIMLPPFQSSNMDGFALNSSAFTHSATKTSPVRFQVLSTIAAGDKLIPSTTIDDKMAYEIMTGAPVPENCDCVIPVEEVKIEGNYIFIEREVNKHENIRFMGEDFPINKIILKKGEKVTAEKIMLLSALGVAHIHVIKPIKIAIMSTGKEIIDDLEKPLQGGQIYNSNSPYLKAALQEFTTEVKTYKTIADDVVQFHKTMDDIEENKPDVIISTGAVSAGKWDFIPNSLRDRKAEIFFHKVAIKPGKPILFAKLNNGPFVFCLPGNPVSTMVGFHFFLSPFFRKNLSMPEKTPINLLLNSKGNKKKGMTFFLKAKSFMNENCQLYADLLHGQESFKMQPLLEANGFVILEDNIEEYTENQKVTFLPLRENI